MDNGNLIISEDSNISTVFSRKISPKVSIRRFVTSVSWDEVSFTKGHYSTRTSSSTHHELPCSAQAGKYFHQVRQRLQTLNLWQTFVLDFLHLTSPPHITYIFGSNVDIQNFRCKNKHNIGNVNSSRSTCNHSARQIIWTRDIGKRIVFIFSSFKRFRWII